MYRIVVLFSIIFLSSCNDGNFEIPSFEFTETVNTCGNYVLYRMNTEQTEALVIQLADTDISNEAGNHEILISESNVQYRIFDGALSNDYFCAEVPPVGPIVIRNWAGVAGSSNKISIETTEILDDTNTITGYEHRIYLLNLVLESQGEQQTFESYYFGSFITNL